MCRREGNIKMELKEIRYDYSVLPFTIKLSHRINVVFCPRHWNR